VQVHAFGLVGSVGRHWPRFPALSVQVTPHGQLSHLPLEALQTAFGPPGTQPRLSQLRAVVSLQVPLGHWQHTGGGQAPSTHWSTTLHCLCAPVWARQAAMLAHMRPPSLHSQQTGSHGNSSWPVLLSQFLRSWSHDSRLCPGHC
jgi:hypothetical protein